MNYSGKLKPCMTIGNASQSAGESSSSSNHEYVIWKYFHKHLLKDHVGILTDILGPFWINDGNRHLKRTQPHINDSNGDSTNTVPYWIRIHTTILHIYYFPVESGCH